MKHLGKSSELHPLVLELLFKPKTCDWFLIWHNIIYLTIISFNVIIIGIPFLRDIISWLMNAAKESVNHSKEVEYPKKEDNCLK